MSKLTKLAQGRQCQVRLPGVCNFNPETTVLAHYSMGGISGKGLKSPDILGAWSCSSCHDECDGRTHKLERDFVRLCHAEGVFRTQAELYKMGAIK